MENVHSPTCAQEVRKMHNKPKITMPIVVEGKYDKNLLKQLFDATVISIDGFGIFNSKEKQELLRRLSGQGLIILTDSDGGGRQIRSFLSGIIPKDKIFNAYIPQIEGKERRKKSPSKAGLLGVEGMDRETLMRALAPFIEVGEGVTLSRNNDGKMITKVDFFMDGLSGADGAVERRSRLALSFGLPSDMTANALLEALNLIAGYDSYREAVMELNLDIE